MADDGYKTVQQWANQFNNEIDNAETDEEGVALVKAKVGANQGVVTRNARILDGHIDTYDNANWQTQRAADTVEEYMAKFLNYCNKFEGNLLALLDADPDQTNHAGNNGYNTKLDLVERTRAERLQRWANLCIRKPVGTRAGVVPPVAAPAPAAPAQPAQPAPRCKVETSLKPDMLTEESKPSEVKQWKRKFRGYYDVSQMQLLDIGNQHTYIRACIDDKLLSRMEDDIVDGMALFAQDGQPNANCWMKAIDKVFQEKYPLMERRYDALTMNQKSGEYFMDFAHRVKEARDEAAINDGMTGEQITAMIYVIGCGDKELRKEFLKEVNPGVQDLERIARNHDRAARGSDTKGSANRASGQKTGSGNNKGGGKTSDRKPNIIKLALESRPDLKGKCICCGKSDHEGKNCPVKDNLKCNSCGKPGHTVTTCLKKDLDRLSGKEVGGANAIRSPETLPVYNKPPGNANGSPPLANYSAAVTGKAMRIRPLCVIHTFDRREEHEEEGEETDAESLPDLCPPTDDEETDDETEEEGEEQPVLAPKEEESEEQPVLAPKEAEEEELPPLVITEELVGAVRRAQARRAQSSALSRDTPVAPL